MSKAYAIEVTREDINSGLATFVGHCAVAQAIKLGLPEARSPKVDTDNETISFSTVDDRIRTVWAMPASVKKWIQRWDERKPVRAFTLNLSADQVISQKPMGTRRTTGGTPTGPNLNPGSHSTRKLRGEA